MTGVTEFAAEPPNELEPRFAKAHGATLIRCDRADDGRIVGRIYEDRSQGSPPDCGSLRLT